MDPFKLIFSAFKRLTTAITSPFRMMIVRFQRLFNINIITAKLVAPLTKKVKSLLGLKPKSKEDYVTVGRFWIFKKLFLTLILVACAGVFIYFMMFAPKLPAQPVQPSAVKTNIDYDYDDMDLREFSGIANIKASDGQIVYTGEIDKGVCSGSGTLYSREGNLLYTGNFEENKYAGAGIQYYPDGAVHYEGQFAGNLYNGEGKLFDHSGELIYEGAFKDGLYDGEGKLYSEIGQLTYEGGFSRGNFHGSGVSYYPDGGMKYQGEFYAGDPQGEGTLYSASGKQLYTGSMYHGDINYRALVNSTLEDIEAAFAETPRIYYSDNDSCFVYEQAGVIISTDCRVQVDTWEKKKTDEEKASEFYYMPGEYGAEPMSVHNLIPGKMEIHFLGAAPQKAVQADSISWFVPSGSATPAPAPRPEDATVEDILGEMADKMDQPASTPEPTPAPAVPEATPPPTQIILPDPADDKPDFVEKDITLYYEIDKNVWQSEDELDKSKVFVKQVTVMKPSADFISPEEPGYDDNLPPSVEDCVAIDHARRKSPTIFSNILFEMDRQNKLFVRLKNISYAERIVQKSYDVDGLTYRCSYPIDQQDKMAYYSIQQQ